MALRPINGILYGGLEKDVYLPPAAKPADTVTLIPFSPVRYESAPPIPPWVFNNQMVPPSIQDIHRYRTGKPVNDLPGLKPPPPSDAEKTDKLPEDEAFGIRTAPAVTKGNSLWLLLIAAGGYYGYKKGWFK